MHQDATWYGGRPHPRGLYVRWGPSPPPKNGAEPLPQFSAHVYCGQTAGWIKMPLGTEVGLGPDDIVLDWDPAPPPQKGGRPPREPQIFGPRYWAGWIKMVVSIDVGLSPGDFVLDGDSAPSPKWAEPPNFRHIFILLSQSNACWQVCALCMKMIA